MHAGKPLDGHRYATRSQARRTDGAGPRKPARCRRSHGAAGRRRAPVISGPRPLSGLRVGVDLDGVCCDYVAFLRGFLLSAGRPPSALPEPVDYELSDWFDTREARVAAHIAAVGAGLHRDAPALPGAAAGIGALRNLGASVVIVSARGSHGEDPAVVRRVFDQPWNQTVPAPRANGWTDLPALLVDLLAPGSLVARGP